MTPYDAPSGTIHEESRRIQRTALYAILLNCLLAVGKAVMAVSTGSLALTASAIDSGTDAVASLVLLGGLHLSNLKTRRFPLGLYKIENMLSVVMALFIMLAGYEIARRAFLAEAVSPQVSVPAIGLQAAATILAFLFGWYTLKVGRSTESPALIAEGRHRQVDAFGSLIVLVSLTLEYFDFQITLLGLGIDQTAAIVVLAFIAHTGWELLADGMRVLLDASIDYGALDQIRKIVASDPMVTEIISLVGRNAGRFRFLTLNITVRADELEKAHHISERIERNIRRHIPHVEAVIIHYEPRTATHRSIAIPLEDRQGTISEHFGEAPFFAIVRVRRRDGVIDAQQVLENPHQRLSRGKGIRVAEWLVEHKVDEVRLREDLKHKGPGYVFADAGLAVVLTDARHLASLVDEILVR